MSIFDSLQMLYHYSENLALGKRTWEQNPWPNFDQGYGTANAVDGSYDNREAKGKQCTVSADGKLTAEWRVDLGNLVSISFITIYYRTDNYKCMFLFIVFVVISGFLFLEPSSKLISYTKNCQSY